MAIKLGDFEYSFFYLSAQLLRFKYLNVIAEREDLRN